MRSFRKKNSLTHVNTNLVKERYPKNQNAYSLKVNENKQSNYTNEL